jgi:hypothetical protein
MGITTKNYFKAISEVGFENLPEVLKKSHLVIEEKTNNGSDWSIYEDDADVKRVFDLAFEKLFEFIDKKEDLSGTEITETKEATKQESALTEMLVKRFLLLNGKTLQKKEIEGFLNDVKAAIASDMNISKEILLIKTKLSSLVSSMGKSIKFEFSNETKRRMQFALNKFKAKTPPRKPKKNTLSGIEEVQEAKPKQNLMSSIDFANLHFNSIGFTGKWLNLIGDPSPGFTAMVFGRPKMGKSYLCVDFAGYLARNHGAVLYVANEEKLDATLQMKLNDKDVKHENLFVSDYLPEDLSKYQFIILDSVNKLGLSPQDLENLKRKNPGKSFIFIFQTTKDGKFKGANSYQHDVDVVIEVPERGKATQFGRFNQGGEMSVFGDTNQELSGVKKPNKAIRKIEIETELGLPLEELAIEFLNKKEPRENIIKILDHDAASIYDKLIKMLIVKIKSDNALVEVKKVEFTEMDSDNLNHGTAYFKVKLEGIKNELEKVAGEDLYFNYDWQSGVTGFKKSKRKVEVPKKVKEERSDDTNPKYMFSTTATILLVEALNGDVDVNHLVKQELANRGLNKDGKWVGFDEAARIHNVKK